MFLQRAFGINPDGTAITDASMLPGKLEKYKSVRTVEQYKDIIRVLTNWGDNAVLKNASSDDSEAAAFLKLRKSYSQGYVISRFTMVLVGSLSHLKMARLAKS
jgi:hypothetical protein